MNFIYNNNLIYNPSFPEIEKLISGNEAFLFHKSLPEYNPTPLHKLEGLASKLGVKEIWIKDEAYRFGLNSFKVLGASFAIHKSMEENPLVQTFCTATDGNHGRAVAWSARKYNRKAVIYIPQNTVQIRIDNIKKEGAEVIVVKGTYDDAVELAIKESKENNWMLVQDSSWEGYEEIPNMIVAGYTTIFKEIEIENTEKFDFIFLQAGVGSFPASAVLYYQNLNRNNASKFICVEPEKADCLFQSAKAGKFTSTNASLDSIMAGLNCGTPSKTAWEILKNSVSVFMTISDNYSEIAMRCYHNPVKEDPQIISGESGAAGLGGLLAILKEDIFSELRDLLDINKNSKILLINTEGDTDPENYRKIVGIVSCETK
jgi:diaminopropionate ammonia-lyase